MKLLNNIESSKGSVFSIIVWATALCFWIGFFHKFYATDSEFALNLFMNILDVTVVSILTTKLLIEIFQKVRSHNGLTFGVMFSVIVSLVLMVNIYVNITMSTINFLGNNLIISGLFVSFLFLVYALFMIGFTRIPTAHAAQVIFFDKRLEGHEFREGPTWWFPKRFGGELIEFYMENRTIELFTDGHTISVHHGMRFKKSPVSLVYRYKHGYLSRIIQMGSNIESDFKEYILDRVRNAVLLIGTSITEAVLDKKYSGLILLLIMDSIKLMKRLINNGAYFESHHLFLELLNDDLYIINVCKAYDEHEDHKNLPEKDKISKDTKLAWFTPERAQEVQVPVFTETQWETLLQSRDVSSLPKKGVYREALENGFEYVKLTIDSFELEDDLAKDIKDRRSETIQEEKEKKNAKTMGELIQMILDSSDGSISYEKAMRVALLTMNTPNYVVKVSEIVGDSNADKIIAALGGALRGGNDE